MRMVCNQYWSATLTVWDKSMVSLLKHLFDVMSARSGQLRSEGWNELSPFISYIFGYFQRFWRAPCTATWWPTLHPKQLIHPPGSFIQAVSPSTCWTAWRSLAASRWPSAQWLLKTKRFSKRSQNTSSSLPKKVNIICCHSSMLQMLLFSVLSFNLIQK